MIDLTEETWVMLEEMKDIVLKDPPIINIYEMERAILDILDVEV